MTEGGTRTLVGQWEALVAAQPYTCAIVDLNFVVLV